MLRNIFLKCPRGSHSLLLGPGRSTWTQQLAGATNISLDHPTSRKKSTYIRAVKEGSLGCIKIDRPKALNAMDAGADGCIFRKENDFQNCLRSSAWTFRDFIRLSVNPVTMQMLPRLAALHTILMWSCVTEMVEAHHAALRTFASQEDIAAILVEGVPRAFCAGVCCAACCSKWSPQIW
jgi:hypothetical protein